jgi:hypothetical protein
MTEATHTEMTYTATPPPLPVTDSVAAASPVSPESPVAPVAVPVETKIDTVDSLNPGDIPTNTLKVLSELVMAHYIQKGADLDDRISTQNEIDSHIRTGNELIKQLNECEGRYNAREVASRCETLFGSCRQAFEADQTKVIIASVSSEGDPNIRALHRVVDLKKIAACAVYKEIEALVAVRCEHMKVYITLVEEHARRVTALKAHASLIDVAKTIANKLRLASSTGGGGGGGSGFIADQKT